MQPIKPKAAHIILGAPRDWDEEKHGPCVGLPVIPADNNYNYSYWRASWRERLAVLFGRPVRLCVLGWPHPPVALDVTEN